MKVSATFVTHSAAADRGLARPRLHACMPVELSGVRGMRGEYRRLQNKGEGGEEDR